MVTQAKSEHRRILTHSEFLINASQSEPPPPTLYITSLVSYAFPLSMPCTRQLTRELHGLNCAGPLIHGSFSVVNTIVLYDLRLVESEDVERWIRRNDVYGGLTIIYTQIFDFVVGQRP